MSVAARFFACNIPVSRSLISRALEYVFMLVCMYLAYINRVYIIVTVYGWM